MGAAHLPNGLGKPVLVNDVHSKLNETQVADVLAVDSLETIQEAIGQARATELPLAVRGGCHAMGGQQFCTGGLLLDTRPLARVLCFDRERGTIEVEAGIQWPALHDYLTAAQDGKEPAWGIRQKQTGADRLSLGGALSANVHGRGLAMRPIVEDVEALKLVDCNGDVHVCSRDEDRELFGLAIGGYGLFGVIYSVTLRLAPRQRLERIVEILDTDDLIAAFDDRIANGFLYGDCQFITDSKDPRFLRRGVFSCYRPAADRTPRSGSQQALTIEQWRQLLYLAHVDKGQAWDLYSTYYLTTSGQLYDSDSHQFSGYVDDYHEWLDEVTGASDRATEMITEIYVPRDRLADFMVEAADDLRSDRVEVIYGTIRLIERDDETALPWAREPWACVIVNLHVVHTPAELEHAAAAFRRLIDMAISRGGSYFLTYHRWALPEQLEACYPGFRAFVSAKRDHDPAGLFQSDWFRHYSDVMT
jgi:FAD/FMN-containing dehydrogenase